MNNTQTFNMQKRKIVNPYLEQKILSASPQQLVAYIYDAGITACNQKDKEKVLRTIQELINSLDFEKGKEVTGTFFGIYRFLREQTIQENFREVKSVLSELRSTWVKAMKVY